MFALYKGTLTPLMGVGLLGSVRFGAYEAAKKRMAEAQGNTVSNLARFDKTLCAFGAGLVNSFLLSPI